MPFSPSRWAGASLLVALALHCGGSPFYEDDGDGAAAGGDDATLADGTGDDVVVVPPGDASRPETSSVDAHLDATHLPDGVADAPSDRKATPDAPGITDAVADLKACQAVCAGCCDSTGVCQAGNTATACGTKGGLCQDCSGKSCGLPSNFGCCTASFGCGCAVGGIVGCN